MLNSKMLFYCENKSLNIWLCSMMLSEVMLTLQLVILLFNAFKDWALWNLAPQTASGCRLMECRFTRKEVAVVSAGGRQLLTSCAHVQWG